MARWSFGKHLLQSNDVADDTPKCANSYNNDWQQMLPGCLTPNEVHLKGYYCSKFIEDINKLLAEDTIAKLKEFEMYYLWKGNAAASFMDYYLSVVNKIQNSFANYVNTNGEARIQQVNGVIKYYNDEYKKWNDHCSGCDVCNSTLGIVGETSVLQTRVASTSERTYSSVEGILIYVEFAELENLISDLDSLKAEVLIIKDSISSLALPEFPGKFSDCSSSFTEYQTNCANKVLDATKEIDEIITRVTEYSDLFKKLNQSVGD